MSKVITDEGLKRIKETLGDLAVHKADDLGVEVPRNKAPGVILERLIALLAQKTGQRVAVLIDEYDQPLHPFIRHPAKMEKVRLALRGYYSQIKASDEHISFIFITGVSKFSRMSILSSFNNLSDISINPDYGALCGFTHEELRRNFGPRIAAAAETLNMGQEELLERMRSYYDGFCFDGKTMVYNPFSTLQFLRDREFDNFWFETGPPELLAQYMRGRRLTVEQFRGVEINRSFARNPGELDKTKPEGFLYQLGYLSLRPGKRSGKFTLDYPNKEVYEAVSQLWVQDFFSSVEEADTAIDALRSAFASGEAGAVIKQFNAFLARHLYDDHAAASRQQSKDPVPGVNFQEWFYRSALLSLLMVAGLDPSGEVHGIKGRTDLVVKTAGKVWVLEFKVFREAGADQETAEAAIAQIREKGYARRYGEDAIAVGIAINDTERAITAWRVLGDEPVPGPGAAEKKRTAAKQKKSLKP
jgi:DNA-binding Lrp family transcriptional regulator